MEPILKNLQTLVSVKEDIKQALIDKKSTPEGGMTTYAEAIRKIKGGAGSCEVNFPDSVALDVMMDDVDITEEVTNDKKVVIPEVNGDLLIDVLEIKSITYILQHVTSSNMDDRIPFSHSYHTELEFEYGYELDQAIVMMNGVDVTDQVYNNDTINIDSIDGDITVTVFGKLKTYDVTNTLTESTTSNSQTKITHGDPYTAIVRPNDHYALTKVYVEMDGNVIYDESWDELEEIDQFTINIPQAIENINIVVESKVVLIVTNVLTNVTTDNSQMKFRYGEEYHAILTSAQYFDFISKNCDDSTAVFTDIVLNETERTRTTEITISSLTKDVVITSNAERVVYTITNDLVETTSSNDSVSIFEGEDYSATFTPSQYFEFNQYTMIVAGEDVTTFFDQESGGFSISRVLGDININVISTRIVVTVTNHLTGITTNNDSTTALMGLDYKELLTVDYNTYDDINVIVTMNGEVIDYHNMANGEINIPLVLGDIVVTATAITESLSQYNTLDHYTMEDIEALRDGEKVDVILTSPRIDHGYIVGYDGEKLANYGNGYKNLIRMQHEIAPVSNNNTYVMELSKKQDTKMEDVYGPVAKPITVTGTLGSNGTVTKLTSGVAGYDLYGINGDLTVGGTGGTPSGTLTITYSGNTDGNYPFSIYVKTYTNNTDTRCRAIINGTQIDSSTNTTTNDISLYTKVDISGKTTSVTFSNTHGGFLSTRRYNIWLLVPNTFTEIEVTGQIEVPDGLPYYALNTKLGGISITNPSNLRAMPDGFNVFTIDSITNANTTEGLLQNNNPCAFKFVRITDNQLLSSGSELGPLQYDGTESDKTIWYLYKPQSAGFSTSTVSVTNNLVNVTSNNATNSVMYGGSYNAQLSWDDSRTPYHFEITMCGHTITGAVYNPETKIINIPYVIGPIVITAECVNAGDMKKITYSLTDVAKMVNKTGYSESMSTGEYDSVLVGDTYTAQPSFDGLVTLSSKNFNMAIEPSDYKFMKIVECYAEIGGQRYDNIYDANTNTITISQITDDCHITISAIYVVGYVDNTYYDADMSSSHIYVETDALSGGAYVIRPTNVGEDAQTNYNDITTFSI